jgi:pimeloyl-ACP methyl ester carboxylesterase
MWALQFVLIAVALYAAVVAGTYFAQDRLQFPTGLVASRVALPGSAQRLQVKTSDGNVLSGVSIPALSQSGQAQPLLIGFSGNAWNAEQMALYLHGLLPEYDVVAFHYRGYAPSTGRPSADALLMDAPILYDHLQRTLGAGRIISIGFSLGSGVAASLARERPITGLILVTLFDALEALARDLSWLAPVSLLLRHRMPVIAFVLGSRVPPALIAAKHDTVFPARRSALLRQAIPNLVLDRMIEAGHNDLYDQSAFADALLEAITKIAASDPARQPVSPNWRCSP